MPGQSTRAPPPRGAPRDRERTVLFARFIEASLIKQKPTRGLYYTSEVRLNILSSYLQKLSLKFKYVKSDRSSTA